jgi:Tol biopolymer transport system component
MDVNAPLPETFDHIWIADARGMQHGLHQITFGAHYDSHPAWSSDSRTIYFVSDRGSTRAIWKVAIQP